MPPDVMAYSTAASSNPRDLPGEIVILIARELDLATLSKLQLMCKAWKTLINDADAQLWSSHARRLLSPDFGPEANGSFDVVLAKQRARCFDAEPWDTVRTWKDLCRQLVRLDRGWAGEMAEARCDILGGFGELSTDPPGMPNQPPTPYLVPKDEGKLVDIIITQHARNVWRARLDTDEDAMFVLATSESGGLQVVDAQPGASSGRVLFSVDNVHPYAHLEYQDGIACWNRSDSIEVWKRWKLVHGSETEDKRGHFVRIKTLPPRDGMRGFMLNKQLQLAVVSELGSLAIWDVGATDPTQLKQLNITSGATGHIEHNDEIVVYSMGAFGYAFYRKQTGESLGEINFQREIGDAYEYDAVPEIYLNIDSRVSGKKTPVAVEASSPLDRAPLNCATTFLSNGRLDDAVFQSALDRDEVCNQANLTMDEWGAAMLRPLKDSSTLFVARSRSGRIFVCSDVMGLLSAIATNQQLVINAKAHQCSCLIECGTVADRDDFHEGGWLAANNGRAAFQIENHIYIIPLPKAKDEILKEGTPCTQICPQYQGILASPSSPVPISFMSLHDDALFSTYVHPVLVPEGFGTQPKWTAGYAKSVRIVRLNPSYASERVRPQLRDIVDGSGPSAQSQIHDMEAQMERYSREFRRQARLQFDDEDFRIRIAMPRLRAVQAEITSLLLAHRRGRTGNNEAVSLERIQQTLADPHVAHLIVELGSADLLHMPADRPVQIEDLEPISLLELDINFGDSEPDIDEDDEFDVDDVEYDLEDLMPAYDSDGERIYNPIEARLARARDNMLVEAMMGGGEVDSEGWYDEVDHDFDDEF